MRSFNDTILNTTNSNKTFFFYFRYMFYDVIGIRNTFQKIQHGSHVIVVRPILKDFPVNMYMGTFGANQHWIE